MAQFPSMQLGKVYFYTATILYWQQLLAPHAHKQIILDSLAYLVRMRKIAVYGFVIMPNHIHIIWEMLEKNGKEMPSASFMKFTGQSFLKSLKETQPHLLQQYAPTQNDREHHFWERNALPIHLYNTSILLQKLRYIHRNPIAGKWQLAPNAEEYPYSSAHFYRTNHDNFGFLSNYQKRYD